MDTTPVVFKLGGGPPGGCGNMIRGEGAWNLVKCSGGANVLKTVVLGNVLVYTPDHLVAAMHQFVFANHQKTSRTTTVGQRSGLSNQTTSQREKERQMEKQVFDERRGISCSWFSSKCVERCFLITSPQVSKPVQFLRWNLLDETWNPAWLPPSENAAK